jgi:26S proteasome regulatory subunit N3
MARHHYYLARVRAMQLDYDGAHKAVLQALRKAPQSTAVGFRLSATKLSVVVQLLMGTIPDRLTFSTPLDLVVGLEPYFSLTKAVRDGHLAEFHKVVAEHSDLFRFDETLSLVQRLRASVIKTGLRNIATAYSNISLATIAAKLNLASVEDAEAIVAKAIRDGVISATIDHDKYGPSHIYIHTCIHNCLFKILFYWS